MAWIAVLTLLIGCAKSGIPEHRREKIDKRMDDARDEGDCLIAADILRELEELADASSQRDFLGRIFDRGWTAQDNELLIGWKAEKRRICNRDAD